jgi:hypothetical protein
VISEVWGVELWWAAVWWVVCDEKWGEMMVRRRGGRRKPAEAGERRDPSEKQEPHTVMWGIRDTTRIRWLFIMVPKTLFKANPKTSWTWHKIANLPPGCRVAFSRPQTPNNFQVVNRLPVQEVDPFTTSLTHRNKRWFFILTLRIPEKSRVLWEKHCEICMSIPGAKAHHSESFLWRQPQRGPGEG